MTYAEDEFQEAEALAKCAEYLRPHDEYQAWWAVTCFYAALHYMRAAIFQGGYKHTANGLSEDVETFYELTSRFHKGRKPHDVLEELVYAHNAKVGVAYRKLRASGDDCRYTRYDLSNDERTDVYQAFVTI